MICTVKSRKATELSAPSTGLKTRTSWTFSPGSSEAPSQLNPILMHSRIRRVKYLKDNHKGLSRDAAESLKQAWDHLKLLDTELSRTIKIFDLVQKLQGSQLYLQARRHEPSSL